MEQNAPNQVIGTGTLEIKPDFRAVTEEMDRIERRWDEIGAKAKATLDLTAQIRQSEEGIGRLVEKIKEVNFDGVMDRFEQRMEAMLQRMAEAGPSEQQSARNEPIDPLRIITEATNERFFEMLGTNVEEINNKLTTLLMQSIDQT